MARAEPRLQGRRARSRRVTARPAASPIATFAPTTSIPRGLAELAALASAATTEFENVPAAALAFLARTARVSPGRAKAWRSRRIASARRRSSRSTASASRRTRCSRARDDAHRVDASLCPGHREERAPRLRRQGTDSRRPRATKSSPPGSRWARSPACIERLVPLAAEVSVVVARTERRRDVDLARRREPASRRHPRRLDRPGARPRRAGGRGARRSRPPSRRSSTIAACCASEMFVTDRRRAASSTRSRRGRTTAATTRSTPASPRSSSSRRACSRACRSATRGSTSPR